MKNIKMSQSEFDIEFKRVQMTIDKTNMMLNTIKNNNKYKPMLEIYENFKKNSEEENFVENIDEMLEVLLSSKSIKYRE